MAFVHILELKYSFAPERPTFNHFTPLGVNRIILFSSQVIHNRTCEGTLVSINQLLIQQNLRKFAQLMVYELYSDNNSMRELETCNLKLETAPNAHR
jgi:hypothetical protein